MRAILRISFLAVLAAALVSSGSAFAETLTVLTHNSFAVSKDVIQAFTDQTGIDVKFVQAGDAGEVVNRAILTKDHPIADVLYGVDNSLLVRAKNAGIFEPYVSPLLDRVKPVYRFDPDHLVTPIDAGYVDLNVDKAALAKAGVPAPSSLSDLTKPAYKGMLVVENPATSSPGLAFMLTTIAHFGEGHAGDWLDFWAALRDNGVQVTSGWQEAYNSSFSRYGGDRPIVVSYTTSPPAEVIFAKEKLATSPTANVLCDQCAWLQIEAAGILKGTPHRKAAEAFIDFMLSKRFQEDMPLNMFVYPVIQGATVPPAFQTYGQVPTARQTATLSPSAIAQGEKR
ncbi:MAG: thiamine ABC transporter substrate-binding protein, partial [Deinococcales bacterium]